MVEHQRVRGDHRRTRTGSHPSGARVRRKARRLGRGGTAERPGRLGAAGAAWLQSPKPHYLSPTGRWCTSLLRNLMRRQVVSEGVWGRWKGKCPV